MNVRASASARASLAPCSAIDHHRSSSCTTSVLRLSLVRAANAESVFKLVSPCCWKDAALASAATSITTFPDCKVAVALRCRQEARARSTQAAVCRRSCSRATRRDDDAGGRSSARTSAPSAVAAMTAHACAAGRDEAAAAMRRRSEPDKGTPAKESQLCFRHIGCASLFLDSTVCNCRDEVL